MHGCMDGWMDGCMYVDELLLNYDQAITVSESNRDDTVYLNYLNVLAFVNTATLTKLRTKIIPYFTVIDRYKTIRQQITNELVLKYPSFNLLNDTEKTIKFFLFNNADSFICKKLGYFIYEALNIRETCNLI